MSVSSQLRPLGEKLHLPAQLLGGERAGTVSWSWAALLVWFNVTETQVWGSRQRSHRGQHSVRACLTKAAVKDGDMPGEQVRDKLNPFQLGNNCLLSTVIFKVHTPASHGAGGRQVLSMPGEIDSSLNSTHTHTPQPSFPLLQSVPSSLSLSRHPPLSPFFYLSSSARFLFTDFLGYFFFLWRNRPHVTALTGCSLQHLKLYNICLPRYTNTILEHSYVAVHHCVFSIPTHRRHVKPALLLLTPTQIYCFFLEDEKYHLWLIMFFFL